MSPSTTQFTLVPTGRLAYLVHHYEALRVDAIHLSPDPSRPPLDYVDHILTELRAELRRREHTVTSTAVSS